MSSTQEGPGSIPERICSTADRPEDASGGAGAYAEIRTRDLFLTNAGPRLGEFKLILTLEPTSQRHLLPMKKEFVPIAIETATGPSALSRSKVSTKCLDVLGANARAQLGT